MNPNYQLGLLGLSHLLIGADGVIEPDEIDALGIIKEREKITHDLYANLKKLRGQKTKGTFTSAVSS